MPIAITQHMESERDHESMLCQLLAKLSDSTYAVNGDSSCSWKKNEAIDKEGIGVAFPRSGLLIVSALHFHPSFEDGSQTSFNCTYIVLGHHFAGAYISSSLSLKMLAVVLNFLL